MAKFNQHGQWALSGDEDTLMFKTAETKQSSKNEVIERKKIDPNSEEAKDLFRLLAKSILEGSRGDKFRQATDQELFGHLVVSEETLAKQEEDWNNQIEDFYKTARKPIKEEYSREHEGWGNGKSFNSTLTEEELRSRKNSVD